MALAVAMNFSCADSMDNPVKPDNGAVVIEDANGNKFDTELIATLNGEVGTEVSLTIGVYDEFDIYGVDFGDGKIQVDTVCYQNGGLRDAEGKTVSWRPRATEFKGTVAGNGSIKVYGKSDVWYLVATGNAIVTSFDQKKLLNVNQMSFSGANVESVELPALEQLTQFTLNNSPVKKLDVSNAAALTSLSVINTNESAFEPQLKEIDLSKNLELDKVVLGGNTYKKGQLTALDFTNNTKLTQISAENNMLTSVKGIPASCKNIYLSNNELETLEFPEFTAKGTIQIQNNKFTLATLPTKPAITTASKYTYAPQPAYQVVSEITDQNNLLDLSSQLIATGVAAEPQTTTFAFFAGEVQLQEGEDYKVVEPGKFTFLKTQAEYVHAVMETQAFPKFTKANAYVTTEFKVSVTAAAEAGKFLYFIGATDGWVKSEQRLAKISDGLYTGYVYLTDPNGWGVNFKLQKVAGSWDDELNGNNLTPSGNLATADEIGNISGTAGEGVYFLTVDLNNKTINGTFIRTMSIIGGFNEWSGDINMTWDAENYCYVATNLSFTGQWKFRTNASWDINLGGTITNLVANGDNLSESGSTIKLYPTRRSDDNIYCKIE